MYWSFSTSTFQAPYAAENKCHMTTNNKKRKRYLYIFVYMQTTVLLFISVFKWNGLFCRVRVHIYFSNKCLEQFKIYNYLFSSNISWHGTLTLQLFLYVINYGAFKCLCITPIIPLSKPEALYSKMYLCGVKTCNGMAPLDDLIA